MIENQIFFYHRMQSRMESDPKKMYCSDYFTIVLLFKFLLAESFRPLGSKFENIIHYDLFEFGSKGLERVCSGNLKGNTIVK